MAWDRILWCGIAMYVYMHKSACVCICSRGLKVAASIVLWEINDIAMPGCPIARQERFERLVSGTEAIESTLHKNLAELLNAEVVLRTVTDVAMAVDWISSTYFYVRATRQPQHYGLPRHLPLDAFRAKLHDMCMIELNGLVRHKIIEMTDGYDVSPTEEGTVMAKYYFRFDTMKQFMQMKSDESIEGLLQLLSKSGEFAEVRLRVVEKRLLNKLNDTNKAGERIRFPIKEKIKSKEMKVNCLIQATLDGCQVYDNALSQEAKHISRTATRLSRGLVLLVWNKGYFRSLLSAVYLSKSLHCGMWENSTFVSRQLPGIGPVLSTMLVMAGKTNFRSLLEANPRDLETVFQAIPLTPHLFHVRNVPFQQAELINWPSGNRQPFDAFNQRELTGDYQG
ncbi:hypothetical protein LSTR_LSTR001384 [Laodelphax striatellus]|uniref:DNA 3'-5' helicase n=1 Tax=Laodelphax striatellus TaxID=195883 RepID=A0A482XA87_LAOST|nr:hypothetical protein LSTR_LSTR001384 [Laodelphax striatellus]